MIHTIEIQGYRGFRGFALTGLGRVNLLVGRNNGGKTSVLEAIHLLQSGAVDPAVLWRILARRGERLYTDTTARVSFETELEVSHLFHGHALERGASFSVTARNREPARLFSCTVIEAPKVNHELPLEPEIAATQNLALRVSSAKHSSHYRLSSRGGLRSDAIESRRVRAAAEEVGAVQFVSTESLTFEALAYMWSQIALTDAESRVVRALQFVEPKIRAIAPIALSQHQGRGGFIVRIAGIERPIPIGSLGDGTWRMLALAIALSRSKDGILLVDEIDTGLHHTVLANMWKLVDETARELNVQVFATTHSNDCVQSLAVICAPQRMNESNVTIQRIERDRGMATPFTEAEIYMAAQRGIEVR